MPPEGVPKISHADLLSLEELGESVAWLTSHVGIERVKLTGGEPLVRKGIERLIAQLVATPGMHEVSMTTNGSLLQKAALVLKAAGLSRVNISLDSLDASRFSFLTHGGQLADTLRGIDWALIAGLTPLKLNVVLQRTSWKNEVPSLLSFAAANSLNIRFIELMQTGTESGWCESEFVPIGEVMAWLSERGGVTPVHSPDGTPARNTLVFWRGQVIDVGWIAPRSHPFCSRCERLRLDPRGFLHRCLMDSSMLSLQPIIRNQTGTNSEQAFHDYMRGKVAPQAMESKTSMSLIGG
jgi:cyclic pyranopterin phosphate synthase